MIHKPSFESTDPYVNVTLLSNDSGVTILEKGSGYVVTLIRPARLPMVRWLASLDAALEHREFLIDLALTQGSSDLRTIREFLYQGISDGFIQIGKFGPVVSDRVSESWDLVSAEWKEEHTEKLSMAGRGGILQADPNKDASLGIYLEGRYRYHP